MSRWDGRGSVCGWREMYEAARTPSTTGKRYDWRTIYREATCKSLANAHVPLCAPL